MPARDSNEHGRDVSGRENLKGNWCTPLGKIFASGTFPSAFSVGFQAKINNQHLQTPFFLTTQLIRSHFLKECSHTQRCIQQITDHTQDIKKVLPNTFVKKVQIV